MTVGLAGRKEEAGHMDLARDKIRVLAFDLAQPSSRETATGSSRQSDAHSFNHKGDAEGIFLSPLQESALSSRRSKTRRNIITEGASEGDEKLMGMLRVKER